jgi:hypothetical protein
MTSTRTMGRVGATGRVLGWDGSSLVAGPLGGAEPLGFAAGDANLYRYVGNDPVNDTDPTGESDKGGGKYPQSDITNLLDKKKYYVIIFGSPAESVGGNPAAGLDSGSTGGSPLPPSPSFRPVN